MIKNFNMFVKMIITHSTHSKMNYKNVFLSLIIILVTSLTSSYKLYSQEMDSIEVYMIESYVAPKIPHNFFLSFFTSDVCKSKLIIENKYEFPVSSQLTDNHKAEIIIEDLEFKSKSVGFLIETEDSLGSISLSEEFEFILPYELDIKSGSSFLTLCLFGGAVFLLPSPVYDYDGDDSYFSLTKEIPVISFRSRSFIYPSGYISIEYSYIFEAARRNYLRAGYKQIVEIPYIEYISPGVSLFTNFLGNNGVSPELALGFFTIKDSFTLYARYRYNIDLSKNSDNFSEISIGLYSSFFSLYLD